MLCNHGRVFRLASEIFPFVRIVHHVIKLFRAVGIMDVAPFLAADAVVALIVTGDGWALAFGRGVAELRDEAEPLDVIPLWHAGQFDERGINIEQLGWLHHSLTAFDTRTCEDKRDFSAAIPEGIFARDFFFPEMPTMISPNDNDGVVSNTRFIQRGHEAANLRIDKTGAGQVTADEIPPLVVLLDPLQPRLWQFPVQIPGKAWCVFAVIFDDLWQDAIVIRIKVEPLLRGIARHMRQKETGCNKEGLILRSFFNLLHRPGSDLVITFPRVVIVQRPDAPVHGRMITHGSGWREFLGWFSAYASVRSGDLEFGLRYGGFCCCFILRLAFAASAATTRATVVDFTCRGGEVAVIFKMLRQGDTIFPLRQGAKPGGETIDAGGGRAQTEQQARAGRIAQRHVAMRIQERGTACRQLVDVGRLGHRMPTDMADPVILVVDGDEKNVRLVSSRKREAESQKAEGNDGFHEAKEVTPEQARDHHADMMSPGRV